MIKGGKGDTLTRLGLTRDGYSPDTVEHLKTYVTGQQGILEEIKAKKAQKLQSQKDKAAMARVKETTASAEKKKTEKEKPILKEIRSQIQSLEKQKESIRAGVDVIPGLENLSPEEAMKNLDARINRLADTYVEEGGSRKQLGVGEKKTAKTRYVYEGGKLTLK
jgi:hypothetical protein